MSMIILSDQFHTIHGEAAVFEILGGSGTLKQNYFCIHCGTMIFGRIPDRGPTMYLRPGTLDDTSWVRAEAHIFVKSKQPWVQLPADVPAFTEAYDRNVVWPEASLARVAARSS